MRILILDDDQTRHDALARRYAEHEVVHVYNVKDAQAALAAGGFDLASFDHDLADYQVETLIGGATVSRELTGYDVVTYLVTEVPRDLWPPAIIVHSWNAPRARVMTDVLREHGVAATYKPFVGG